ncbi:MAG TPA: LapA family protein [Candidatus Deferrimicrobium sp.]|nr:LapA family protein [Candidatus Deferrimicrobium sp.]
MWVLRAVLTALMVVCIVAFAVYNIGPDRQVSVDLIWARFIQVPLVTVVFWAFAAGVFVSLLLFISVYIKLWLEVRNARKQVRALETEVTVLRNRPLDESADLLRGQRQPKGSLLDADEHL